VPVDLDALLEPSRAALLLMECQEDAARASLAVR
jgi:hypothetical protein